jgi:hypothetical protein
MKQFRKKEGDRQASWGWQTKGTLFWKKKEKQLNSKDDIVLMYYLLLILLICAS